jgi:hypothetical protein
MRSMVVCIKSDIIPDDDDDDDADTGVMLGRFRNTCSDNTKSRSGVKRHDDGPFLSFLLRRIAIPRQRH